MRARIYRPAKTAMQSGPAPEEWVLEFAPSEQKRIDPLMGWTGSGDTQGQVRLTFTSKDDALAYAKRHDIKAIVVEPKTRKPSIRSLGYGGNFAHSRRGSWTH